MIKINIKFNKCGTEMSVYLKPHVADLWLKEKKAKRAINKIFTIKGYE